MAHGVVLCPKPSALHTLRSVSEAHVASPGVHTRVMHAPITHAAPEGQSRVLSVVPRASHSLTCVADAHERDDGVHRCAAHAPSGAQN